MSRWLCQLMTYTNDENVSMLSFNNFYLPDDSPESEVQLVNSSTPMFAKKINRVVGYQF